MSVEKSDILAQPNWNEIVWRYMSLNKFFDLLINKKLVLSCAGNMTDRNEVLFPVVGMERKLKKEGKNLSDYDSALFELEKRCESLKEEAYISSWSSRRTESYALWKIYLSGTNPGAAIRTNFKALIESIRTEERVISGKVIYTTDYWNILKNNDTQLHDHHIICSKYEAYEYENEVRLFVLKDTRQNFKGFPLGRSQTISLDVDLVKLIHEIHLSPWSGFWFRKSFLEIVERFEPKLKDKVKFSEISDS